VFLPRQVTVHIMGMQRNHLGSSDKGPSPNNNSCNPLIDHTLRAASHITSHPTSCANFATRGALSVSAQLASSDSLPILKIISLSRHLETPPPPFFSKILSKLSPKALLHQAQSLQSSPMETKALLYPHSLPADTSYPGSHCSPTHHYIGCRIGFSSFRILFASSSWKVSKCFFANART